jgi:NAD(P)-dependent dehydrogenase (short-subunit alcohol dehydrogenase family)
VADRLSGKVAVITGAASGIGKATVELFAREGAKVIAADIQDEKGQALAESCGANVAYVRCNVMDENDIAGIVEAAISKFGRIDFLFSNAGAGGSHDPIDAVTVEAFDDVMHLHLRAALLAIKYATPHMKAQGGGSIVATGSVAGIQAGLGPPLYSVAKGAIHHMIKVAACQLGADNIRVNCICPGLIATPIVGRDIGLSPDEAEKAVERIAAGATHVQPIPRGGRPTDIAEAALYLASDASSFVSGHALVVDGGQMTGMTDELRTSLFAPVIDAVGLPSLAY